MDEECALGGDCGGQDRGQTGGLESVIRAQIPRPGACILSENLAGLWTSEDDVLGAQIRFKRFGDNQQEFRSQISG